MPALHVRMFFTRSIGILLIVYTLLLPCTNAVCTNDDGSTCAANQCCYDDIPDILGDGNSTINPTQACYDSGTRVDFDCSGPLNGPPFNECNDEVWGFPFAPTCESTSGCTQPTVPTDGSITPDSTEYDLYTRIYYYCNDGFSLVGPSEAVCESGGGWNPSTTPTCEADCDAPVLPNGSLNPDKSTYVNGEILSYQCNTNYTLVGISTTTCRDGAFDPSSLPTCYAMCNPPVVANSDYSSQQDPIDHSSTITVTCDAGFSTGIGSETDMTCSNGVFDVDPPTCYENCPVLSAPFENGVRNGDSAPYYHDEMVSYTCDSGYTLVGSASITCQDGEWDNDEPVCLANCPVDSVPNSDYASGGEVDHGTTFNITCNTGFSTGTALATEYTCNDGVLSPSVLPTCYADCTPPIVEFSDYNVQKDDVFHTTNITISCWGNYSTGPDSTVTTLTCDDGSFSNDAQVMCYENCPDISAPVDGEITNGSSPFYHEEVAAFQCNENFTLVGDDQITCSDGMWSSDPPECLAQCVPPVIPYSDATLSSPLLDHAEQITVMCNEGYSNGQSRRTTSNCTAGVLVPEVPLCYEDCTPPVVSNSNYATQLDDVMHTTPIIITCDTGFSTGDSLNTSLTCIDGTFNGTTPTCYADCSPPVVPYSDYAVQRDDVYHDTEFIVSCWSNYSTGPDSQQTEISCLNGQLSSNVTCYANCRVPEVDDSDYSTLPDDPYVFHQVTFNVTCDDGFSNSEAVYTSLTCDNGNISDSDPTCYANCPDFGDIENGSYSGDAPPFFHLEAVAVTCDTNHTLVGNPNVTCANGNWSSSIPSCEADCLPPVIPNSDFSEERSPVNHGVQLNITCDTGYSTGFNLTQRVTCDDGSFTPSPLDCLRDCTPPIVNQSDYATQQKDVYTSQSFTITCDVNYTVGAGDSTATTELTCTDGELDVSNVTCYANCPDPGVPADGKYEYASDGFYHGTVVYYICDERFDLAGESEILCTDGEWSAAQPNCTDKAVFDLIMLTCGPTSMEVEIPLALLDGIDTSDLGMEGDLSCGGYIDGDMMRVNTSLAGCGTNKTENATYDVYTNRVINNYGVDVITRVVDVQIPLKCSYARSEQVRAVRYVIDDYVLGKNLEETGTYKMTFGIYRDPLFEMPYGDGEAVDIDINSDLYFQLELVTDVTDNFLVAQECWATPTADDSGSVSHDLLDSGCPVDTDLEFLSNNGDSTDVQFKLSAFRFVDDEDKEVYVHCEVFVCHNADSSDPTFTYCNVGCPSDRKRRRSPGVLSPHDRAAKKAQAFLESQRRPNNTLGKADIADDLDSGDRIKRASSHHDPIVKFVKAGPFGWMMPKGGSAHNVDTAPHAGGETHNAGLVQPEDPQSMPESTSMAWMHSVIGMGVVIIVFSLILVVVVRHYRRRLTRDYRYQPVTHCG